MQLTLTEQEWLTLNRWIKSWAVGDKQKLRAKMVLMTADGCQTREIIVALNTTVPTLNRW